MFDVMPAISESLKCDPWNYYGLVVTTKLSALVGQKPSNCYSSYLIGQAYHYRRETGW
jgi:hypothetical protein